MWVAAVPVAVAVAVAAAAAAAAVGGMFCSFCATHECHRGLAAVRGHAALLESG